MNQKNCITREKLLEITDDEINKFKIKFDDLSPELTQSPVYVEIHSKTLSDNVVESLMTNFDEKNSEEYLQSYRINSLISSYLCFDKKVANKPFKLILQQKNLQKVNLSFTAQAEIRIIRENGENSAYNGNGVKSLLSNYMKDWSAQSMELKSDHVAL